MQLANEYKYTSTFLFIELHSLLSKLVKLFFLDCPKVVESFVKKLNLFSFYISYVIPFNSYFIFFTQPLHINFLNLMSKRRGVF